MARFLGNTALHRRDLGRCADAGIRDKIDDALHLLRHSPRLDHRRDHLPSAQLAYLVGSHVIIYRIGVNEVGVLRILHQRMSLPRHV